MTFFANFAILITSNYSAEESASTELYKAGPFTFISADADAKLLNANAGVQANPTYASATAAASVAGASAGAALIKDVVEVTANADFCKAEAGVSFDPLHLKLIEAKAGAAVAKANMGITNTPLQGQDD